ncbi:hypothetical protein ATCC90586_001745 [Pythium insidiosum]|nr:hypothetical protein ATCC90586_001745 [Pythium insidiosum]
MYNGIGLRTVRGSGTNGYVQRNLSFVNPNRARQKLSQNQSLGNNPRGFDDSRRPKTVANPDILLHEQKRQIEVKLLELSMEMEERGCDEDEIADKVSRERDVLLARLKENTSSASSRSRDDQSSHARAQRKEEENRRMKEAFGIEDDYAPGESFDPELIKKRKQERSERRKKEREEREEARRLRLKEREEQRTPAGEIVIVIAADDLGRSRWAVPALDTAGAESKATEPAPTRTDITDDDVEKKKPADVLKQDSDAKHTAETKQQQPSSAAKPNAESPSIKSTGIALSSLHTASGGTGNSTSAMISSNGGVGSSGGLARGGAEADVEPLLTSSSPSPGRCELGASSATGNNSVTGGAPSFARVLPVCLRRSRVYAWTGGVTWVLKGLCVCLGMMLVGVVGSFTLHQMMSPQIESLLRQRSDLQRDMEQLQHQINNLTRIAESRLEMIHLLEKELERQAVEAAAAAADPTRSAMPGMRFGSPKLQGPFFWSTLMYAWVLGSLVLIAVAYRIVRIAKAEAPRAPKARASSAEFPSGSSGASRLRGHRADDLVAVDLEANGDMGLLSGAGGSTGRTVLSPRCYKRGPASSPTFNV